MEDGHDSKALSKALTKSTIPLCLIAETTKGKGVDFMENSVLWHYKSPSREDVEDALLQLKDKN